MLSRSRLVVVTLASITLAASALASALEPPYLSPARHVLDAGQPVDIQIVRGVSKAATATWPATPLPWVCIRGPVGQQNLHNVSAAQVGGSTRQVTPEPAGLTLIGANLAPQVATMSGAAFAAFLKQNVADYPADKLPAADATVRIRQIASAKTFVRARSSDGAAYPSSIATSKVGQDVEIRPLMDPTTTGVGGDLPLRTYVRNGSRRGAQVHATHVPSGKTQSTTTDDVASAVIRLNAPGLWRVHFHHVVPLTGDPQAEWELFTATLSFEVPATLPKPGTLPRGGVTTSVAGYVDATPLGPAPTRDFGTPFTGRVSAVACHPTDPNTYYVGGADGGVWRTTDGGANWTPLTDDMPTTATGAIVIDPVNPDTIYVGTGEANYANHSRHGLGIFKSTDGGDTWTQLAEATFAGRTFSKMAINPQNPQILFAAVARAGGFPALAAAKGHPGAAGPTGIFRSADGGHTWTHLLNGLPDLPGSDVAINPQDPNVVYAAIGEIFGDVQNGVYKSTDGGDTWTQLGGGLPQAGTVGRVSVALAPSNPDRLYAMYTYACTDTGAYAYTLNGYRSDDGGATWTSFSLSGLQASYGWFLSIISVHPTKPDQAYFGGVNLRRTENGGGNFAGVTPPHVDMHAIDWDAAGRMLVGDDGGVHRSDDEGSNWVALNDGLGLIQFYAGISTNPADPDFVLGGTQDNGSSIRPNDSQIWRQVFGGDGGWTQSDITDINHFIVEYQGTGNIFQTFNGGNYFTNTRDGIVSGDRNCFLPPYLIFPEDPTKMLYATHRVYRTTISGLDWTPISGDLTSGSPYAIRALALSPANSDIVYAATNDGRVQRSTDGGETFTLIAEDVPGWPRVTREVCPDPVDPNTVYLAVANYGTDQVRRSTDAGQTWQTLDGDLPDVPVNVLAVDARPPVPVIYAGAEDGLYRSINDGVSWTRYAEQLPHTPVIDLRLETERGRIVVGTQGRGAWSVALPCLGDANCDGFVNFRDIDYFVAAQNDNISAWQGLFGGTPTCPFANCDTNADGFVNFRDIDAFVALQNTTCPQ